MNAHEASQLVTQDYLLHVEALYPLIKERAKQGFRNLRISKGIWIVNSDLNIRARKELEDKGYNTYLITDKANGISYMVVEW